MAESRLAVLLSGRGSNFLAIHDAIERGELPAEIVLVASNRPGAGGIEAATALGYPTFVRSHQELPTRREHEEEMAGAIERSRADLIVLAGYMRLLSPAFVARFRQRILNVHPSLLPAFPGVDAQHQAFDYGVRISGCTVHLVDEGLDSGPIVVQRAVPVLDGDDAETLAARILEQEHQAYPEAIRRLVTERWRIEGRRVVFG